MIFMITTVACNLGGIMLTIAKNIFIGIKANLSLMIYKI